jgi:hypothetical protein
MRHVLIKRAAELTGYSVAAIQTKIAKGVWLEGIHYIKAPDGRVFIDTEEVEKWIVGEFKLGEIRSRSTSTGKGSASGRL